ncbi:MAG: M1 family metallopeptidase [Chloroflexi bacterium]|nr:M1 family metallopeptidase [Chloroflexota bacterium]
MCRNIFVLLLLLTSCNFPATRSPTSPPAVPRPAGQMTETPVTEARSPSIPEREKYTLETSIDYDLHTVNVQETILYPNHTGRSLDKLVLAVAPNLWPKCFVLNGLSADNIPVLDFSLNAHRLEVPLPASHPLAPDSVATISLSYKLNLPFLDQAHSLRARIFGYGDIQMNLVNWYPYIVPWSNGDWVIHEPWSHGEYLVYPAADFEVNLRYTDPDNQPVTAASGFAESDGESIHYTLSEGRAFAISASRDFLVSSTRVGDVTVYSYYLPIYQQAGLAALNASAQALQIFSQKFGPYPHKTLSMVMADFKDSMEFSGLYFHSRSFYDLYDGRPDDYLTFVAVHETGHQWWFDQVANDQALEPWLDESLTTYSESIFYETLYPDLLPLWWSKRIDFFEPKGYIDIPVYEGQNDETYKNTVYFNGAHFLQDLRERIGDETFLVFLQDYYLQGQGRIMTANDFFRILDGHADVDYSDIVRAYFKNR